MPIKKSRSALAELLNTVSGRSTAGAFAITTSDEWPTQAGVGLSEMLEADPPSEPDFAENESVFDQGGRVKLTKLNTLLFAGPPKPARVD
jgi:hypothetical protein